MSSAGPVLVTGRRPRRPADVARVRAAIGLALALAMVAVACAGTTTSPSASPGASASGGANGSPQPRATNWPGSIVEAVLALATADAEIAKAGVDLQAAAAAGDVEALWGAADGLAKLIDGVDANVDRLEAYEPMLPLAAQYRAAFGPMLEGSVAVRDGITAGDAGAVETGTVLLAQGVRAYGEIRGQLGALVEQALGMKRLLVK